MKFKTLIHTIAFLTTVLAANAAATGMDDASLKQRILGTWYSEYEWKDSRHPESWIKASGEDNYQDDGLLIGTADYQYPDRKDTLSYEARWNIEDGYLLIEISESSGGFIKKGTRTKDKILFLSDKKMELQAEDGKIVQLHKAD